MRDSMMDSIAVRQSLPSASRAVAATTNGSSVDTAGSKNFFRVGMLVAVAGAITDGTHAVTVEHSDNGTTGWTVLPPECVEGALTPFASASQNTTQRLGLRGTKRFLRANVIVAGAPTTGGIVGALILLGSGSGRPVT